jgi:hypothetical protein
MGKAPAALSGEFADRRFRAGNSLDAASIFPLDGTLPGSDSSWWRLLNPHILRKSGEFCKVAHPS